MYIKYNKGYLERARLLRNNMTKEEKRLWYDFLSMHKSRFVRQKIIENYIVDFYCPSKKLVIELDGSQHYTENGLEYDQIRAEILYAHNLKILRFKNYEIQKNFKSVCNQIDKSIL